MGLGSCLVILSFVTIYRRVNRSEDNDFDRLKATSTREKTQRLTDFKYYIVILSYAKLAGRVFDIAFYIEFLVVSLYGGEKISLIWRKMNKRWTN